MTCNSWCELSRTEEIRRVRRDINSPMIFSYNDFMKPFFFDRLPNSTDTWFFKNIFKMYDEDFSVFYKAHKMVWDQTLALILYGKGNVYVDPKIVSHHRTIIEKDGTNYQSLYAREDHKETDAYMYAKHEEYIEEKLHRDCSIFYKVRAEIFAEAFFVALKSRKKADIEIMVNIWKQRKRKMPLIVECMKHAKQTLYRKLKKGLEKKNEL